jgi:hypothetical protein
MTPPDPDLSAAAADFKRGGWIVSLLGALGMMARMILTDERQPVVVWIKRVVAGGIVGVLMYFALHGSDIDPLYKSILFSVSGAIAPDLFEKSVYTLLNKLWKRK